MVGEMSILEQALESGSHHVYKYKISLLDLYYLPCCEQVSYCIATILVLGTWIVDLLSTPERAWPLVANTYRHSHARPTSTHPHQHNFLVY